MIQFFLQHVMELSKCRVGHGSVANAVPLRELLEWYEYYAVTFLSAMLSFQGLKACLDIILGME